MNKNLILLILPALLLACNSSQHQSDKEFKVDYEKFELDNGLDVIFHIDRSDPVVAVALTVHVGSAREKSGRTGFAHLFEHLLFLESENLGKGGLDRLSARIGGSGANGSTSRDRTNYFQTVPNNALEKMLWAEADKLGWFINTVTEPVLAKEKQVVKNEKRQGIDNRPYGHTGYVIDKNLYSEDHTYNWQVIGSLEDLQNATLDDVKEFYKRWYVPNNSTLVVSGDFDTEQAREWVHKYFDEIPKGEAVEPQEKKSAEVKETVYLVHEDNFANLPELSIAWPAVEQYHPDAYALQILSSYLSEGKKAPLYKSIVEEDQLSSEVSMYHYGTELAGQVHLVVRAFSGKDLDSVYASIQKGLADFEKAGISEKDLSRIKAVEEMNYYYWLSSVLGKGFQLAQYNIFLDDPGYINQDIQNTLAVTQADITRVYEKYIKNRNFVATSFVPKDQKDLALAGSVKADVVEEVVVQGTEESFDPSHTASYEPTPSSFDRSVEPPYGKPPEIKVPEIWKDSLSNELSVYGVEIGEVPLVQFTILLEGGQLMDDFSKPGVANLTAKLMTRGTRNKTPEQLEDAIQQLGASIEIRATKENLKIEGNTLARNYGATIDLLEEILFEPRWDTNEFALLKQSVISRIQQQEANPNSIAANTFSVLIYGEENILSKNILGTEESVQAITIDDVKNFYTNRLSPSLANMHVVGAIDSESVMNSLEDINVRWKKKELAIPSYSIPEPPAASVIYFFDVPNAKQSVFRFGYPALAATDADYYPSTVMNYKLGGGGFASRLMQEVREGKGYTYGIRSDFQGAKNKGPFTISTSVRTNISLEAAQLIKDILENYGTDFSKNDLETTKSSLIKSNARAFETAGAKLYMLENISSYNWNYNYVNDREQIVREMTADEIKDLAKKYTDPHRMIWLVVGDAHSQLNRLKELNFGDPVLISK